MTLTFQVSNEKVAAYLTEFHSMGSALQYILLNILLVSNVIYIYWKMMIILQFEVVHGADFHDENENALKFFFFFQMYKSIYSIFLMRTHYMLTSFKG